MLDKIPDLLGDPDWLTSRDRPYDPSLDEELDAAGLETDDLLPEDEELDEIEIPESIAGWTLKAEEDGYLAWEGDGGSPPAGFDREETSATVIVQSHGGRWKHRWSTKVRYDGPDNNGEERNTTSTIASHKLTRSTGDKGYARNKNRAIESAIEWMEDHSIEEFQSKEGRADVRQETLKLVFGSRELANAARDWLPDVARTGHYDRRHKTVEVYTDELTESEELRLQGEAADSKAQVADQFGQRELTDAELRELRDRRDWSPQKRFHAQAAKAILRGTGVDDWLAYYDLSLTVDEHRGIAEAALQDEHGQRRDAHDREGMFDKQFAEGYHRVLSEGCDHARTWCEQGSDDACEYLIEECDWTPTEVDELVREIEAAEVEMDSLQTDDGGRVEPETALDAPAVPERGEIPGFAKGTLQRAWTGYKAAIADAEGDRATAEQFEASRSEAERYAQIVNEVRNRFDQEPMEFDRLSELNEVAPIEPDSRPTNEENTTGFEVAIDWSKSKINAMVTEAPYDPLSEDWKDLDSDLEDLTDLEKGQDLHATRSEKAQEMDESIQAKDQIVDFETWSDAPNMMDFVGVDDAISHGGMYDPIEE